MSISFKEFINGLKSDIKNMCESKGMSFYMSGEKDGQENLLHTFEFKHDKIKGEILNVAKDKVEIEVNRKTFTIKDKALADLLDKHKIKYATQDYKAEHEFNDKKIEDLLIQHLKELKIIK